jgi:hypothetical protein
VSKPETPAEAVVNCGCGVCIVILGVCATVAAVVATYRYVGNN